ncbi:hypothetical protein Tsubulata_034907, partial [Turnera subulata]
MAPRSREEEEENVYNQAKRHEEMIAFMEQPPPMLAQSSLRRSETSSPARLISSLEQKEITEPGRRRVTMIRGYRARVEAELSPACDRILKLLESRLIPSATAAESKVLYLKMKGDHHRYLAELKREKALGGSTMKEEYLSAVEAYQRARDIAREELAATHPVRLELALNFSVFCRDILKDSFAGYHQARLAVEGADAELGKLEVEEESNKDSTTLWILQLLRDNLTLWGEPAETQVPGESMDRSYICGLGKKITEPGRHRATMIRDYRARVEAELSSACDRILKLLESRLIPSATAAESKVLYLKMKGDHHRYLAELKRTKALGGSTMKEEILSAVEAYQRARDIAREELAATHPVRLELALNFSVFCHDILKDSFAGYHQARLADHRPPPLTARTSKETPATTTTAASTTGTIIHHHRRVHNPQDRTAQKLRQSDKKQRSRDKGKGKRIRQQLLPLRRHDDEVTGGRIDGSRKKGDRSSRRRLRLGPFDRSTS